MEFVFDNERPIYIQLLEMMKMEIISGGLKQGEKIPSVRELSLKAKVNPNTMQKALAELEREGLIYTERTNGKYVTNEEAVISELRNNYINERIDSFLSDMKSMGISSREIKEYLQTKERNEEE